MCSLSWPVIYHPAIDGSCAFLETTNQSSISAPSLKRFKKSNNPKDKPFIESVLPSKFPRWSFKLLNEQSICPYHQHCIDLTLEDLSSQSCQSHHSPLIIEPVTPWFMNEIILYNHLYYEKHTVKPLSEADEVHYVHDPVDEEEIELLYQCNTRSIFLYETMYESYSNRINQSMHRSSISNQSARQSINQSITQSIIQPISMLAASYNQSMHDVMQTPGQMLFDYFKSVYSNQSMHQALNQPYNPFNMPMLSNQAMFNSQTSSPSNYQSFSHSAVNQSVGFRPYQPVHNQSNNQAEFKYGPASPRRGRAGKK